MATFNKNRPGGLGVVLNQRLVPMDTQAQNRDSKGFPVPILPLERQPSSNRSSTESAQSRSSGSEDRHGQSQGTKSTKSASFESDGGPFTGSIGSLRSSTFFSSQGSFVSNLDSPRGSLRGRSMTPRLGALTARPSYKSKRQGSALILVNIQNDFFSDSPNARQPLDGATEELVQKCNLLKHAVEWDLVVLVRDTYVSNHATFHTNLPVTKGRRGKVRGSSLEHCVLGSQGADFHSSLRRDLNDVVIDTGRNPDVMPWGCSDNPDYMEENPILSYLRNTSVSHVYLCGLMTDTKLQEIAMQIHEMGNGGFLPSSLTQTILTDVCVAFDKSAEPNALRQCTKHDIRLETYETAITVLKQWKPTRQIGEGQPHEVELRTRVLQAAGSSEPISDMNDLLAEIQDPINKGTTKIAVGSLHPVSRTATIHHLCTFKTSNAVTLLKAILDTKAVSACLECGRTRMTPLLIACSSGNHEMVQALLHDNKQASAVREHLFVQHADHLGYTAILHAIQSKSIRCIDVLSGSKAADLKMLLSVRDKYDRSAAMIAAEAYSQCDNGKQVYRHLRDSFPESCKDPSKTDAARWSFWHFAVKHDLNFVITSELKEQRKMQGARGPKTQNTFLKETVKLHTRMNLRAQSVTTSLNEQAHSQKTDNNVNLLHLAACCGSTEVTRHLVNTFKSFGMQDECMGNGMNALDIAMEDVNPDRAFMLVKSGCLPRFHRARNGGASPLILLYKALFTGDAIVVRNLLTHHGHGLILDRSLMTLGMNQNYTNTCSKNLPDVVSKTVEQPWFRINGFPDVLVCTTCALKCFPTDHVSFEMVRSGRCDCKQLGDHGHQCLCQGKNEKYNTRVGKVNVRPLKMMRYLVPQDSAEYKVVESEARYPGAGFKSNKITQQIGLSLDHAQRLSLVNPNSYVNVVINVHHKDYIARVFLASAASYGQVDLVRDLVKEVNEIEFIGIDESLENPLHLAVRHNHVDVCRVLCETIKRREIAKSCLPDSETGCDCFNCKLNKSHLDRPNTAGATYLTLAAAFGLHEICALVATHHNMVKLDGTGLSPLHHAVRNNYPKVVLRMAESLCQNENKIRGSRVLNELHLKPDKESVREWSRNRYQSKANLLPPGNDEPKRRKTLLPEMHQSEAPSHLHRRATMHNFKMQMRVGIVTKIDTSSVQSELMHQPPGALEAHANPLHLAVRYGHRECVQALLEVGASPAYKDGTCFSSYQTALWQSYRARVISKTEATASRQTSSRLIRESRIFSSKKKSSMVFVAPTVGMGLEAAGGIMEDISKDRKINKKRQLFAFKRFYQDISIPFLIALCFLLLTLPKSSGRYLTRRWAMDSFDLDNLVEANHVDDVWYWAESRLTDTASLLPSSFASGNVTTTMPGLVQLGPIRLRQQRSVVHQERFPLVQEGISSLLHPRVDSTFASRNVDSTAFASGMSGQALLDMYTSNISSCQGVWDASSNNPWRFVEDTDWLLMRTYNLDVGSIVPKGYDALLMQGQRDQNIAKLRCLRESNWIDKSMRALLIDIPLYNMNTGSFVAVVIVVMQTQSGDIKTSNYVDSSTLGWGLHDDIPLSRFDYPGRIMEAVAIIQLISTSFQIAFKVTGQKRGLKQLTHLVLSLDFWYDGATVISLLFLIVIDFRARDVITSTFNGDFRIDTDEFVPLSAIIDWVDSETRALSVTCLFIALRMLAHCVLLPVIGPLIIAVFYTLQSHSVLTFLFLLLYMLGAYILVFTLMMAQIKNCHYFSYTGSLVFQMASEEWNSDAVDLLQKPAFLSKMLLVVFMLMLPIIFMNLFISVLSEVYPREKARAERQYDSNITIATEEDHVKRMNPLIRRMSPSHPRLKLLKFLYVILLKPTLERCVMVAAWIKSDNIPEDGLAFGWTDASDQMEQHLTQGVIRNGAIEK